MCVLLITRLLRLVGRLNAPKGWLLLLQQTVCNSCVIKVFGGVLVLSRCFLDCSVGVGAFVIGLSQISFFSLIFICFNRKYSDIAEMVLMKLKLTKK